MLSSQIRLLLITGSWGWTISFHWQNHQLLWLWDGCLNLGQLSVTLWVSGSLGCWGAGWWRHLEVADTWEFRLSKFYVGFSSSLCLPHTYHPSVSSSCLPSHWCWHSPLNLRDPWVSTPSWLPQHFLGLTTVPHHSSCTVWPSTSSPTCPGPLSWKQHKPRPGHIGPCVLWLEEHIHIQFLVVGQVWFCECQKDLHLHLALTTFFIRSIPKRWSYECYVCSANCQLKYLIIDLHTLEHFLSLYILPQEVGHHHCSPLPSASETNQSHCSTAAVLFSWKWSKPMVAAENEGPCLRLHLERCEIQNTI